MDTVQHATWGYAFGLICTRVFGIDDPIYIPLFWAVIGALPDLVGEAERIIKGDRSLWGWYNMAHEESSNLFMFLPPYALHVVMDKFTHGPGEKWWKFDERLWVEVVGWISVLVLLIFLLR